MINIDHLFDEEMARHREAYRKHQANLAAWREFNATKHWVPNLRVHDLGSSVADLAIAMERRLGITTNGE